jgi:hypothetical protein
MTGFRRASLPAALLVSLTMIVVACGGSAATPTPVPAGEATPPPAGEATPTPEATPPTGEETPDLPIPTFDLDALTGAIPGVDSYRTSFTVGGTKSYETVVVTQPVLSKAITTYSSDGSVESRLIVIGDEIWQADGTDGAFESVPGSLGQSMLLAFDPTLMLAAYSGLDWATGASDEGMQEKNGVQARHLRIDGTTMLGLAGVWPAGAAIDVWVAEAGYIVAWDMSGFEAGQDVSIQVTNVNDPANKVEAPN